MPNALLLGYDLDQPSFRHRMQSIVAPLSTCGWTVRTERYPKKRYGLRTWERRELLRWADVVVLHQIKLSGIEARLLGSLSRHRVFDVDDALYVRKPKHRGQPADESSWRRQKFAATCKAVDVVAAGNQVLAQVARPHAHDVVILPTSIDTARYLAPTPRAESAPVIAWIGSPENLVYMQAIRPALAQLAVRHPLLKVRIICSEFPDWPEISIERIAWSTATEAQSLAGSDIGIMPLEDDEWARGKCAFKLLQYMAASLPCVASPIGANTEAVIHGVTGFHARTTDEWLEFLQRLIDSSDLRARFGANGHAHVEERYAMHSYRTRYIKLLSELAARG